MAPADRVAAETFRRRLERERAARHEAEAIAERVTGELYASKQQLERVNAALVDTNDELQSLNQALREFVAIASHDLRSPLTSILGMTALLLNRWDDVDESKRREFMKVIERQGHHLNRMVEDLLTVSRIEAGELDTHGEVLAVREALDAIVAEFAQHDQINIDADDTQALVDPEHFHRIFSNYIGNALKYGAPPVDLVARRVDGWIEIRVCDHGDGVPEDFVPRLFGKFARGEEARAKGGTGLGLSIVQGLARANGGDTFYEPNVPHGAIFGVRLPQRVA